MDNDYALPHNTEVDDDDLECTGCGKTIVECEQYYCVVQNLEAYEMIDGVANVTVIESTMTVCLCMDCHGKARQ